MSRTSPGAVQALLGADYGALPNSDYPDLQQYIDTAGVIVDRTVTAAGLKGISLSAAEQELIERWLGAHYYTKMDATYTSRTTQGATGAFVQSNSPWGPEKYKDGAINVDYSGCLRAILQRSFASLDWPGKTSIDCSNNESLPGGQ